VGGGREGVMAGGGGDRDMWEICVEMRGQWRDGCAGRCSDARIVAHGESGRDFGRCRCGDVLEVEVGTVIWNG